ncbi:hypothetical protein A2U01_0107963, partial [Trifolium medium]|nr:hypothetical protein [Trifolium medium]
MRRGKPYNRGGRRPDEGGSSGGRGSGVRNCLIVDCRVITSMIARRK